MSRSGGLRVSYRRANLGQLTTKVSPVQTRREIEECFRKWGIDEYRIPRDGKSQSEAALIIFYVDDRKQELKCSRFYYYRENLRALYLILDSLRKAHDRGILSELARAAVAFLPAGSEAKRPWYEILQVTPTTSPEVVKASYKALAKQRHPDAGGSDEAMRELNGAWEEFEASGGAPA